MLKKFSTVFLTCTALSLVPFAASTTGADAHPSQAAEDVLAGVAIGVIGAAIAKHHHHHGSDYQDHPQASQKENDIGRCMKRTHQAMSNQGFYDVDLVQTIDFRVDGAGVQHVELEVSRTKHNTHSYINVFCQIEGGQVIRFSYNHH